MQLQEVPNNQLQLQTLILDTPKGEKKFQKFCAYIFKNSFSAKTCSEFDGSTVFDLNSL